MPKFKPHSGMKKRVKLTGSGKLRREQTNRRHLLEVKSSSRKRRLEGSTAVWGLSPGGSASVGSLLPAGGSARSVICVDSPAMTSEASRSA